MPDTHTGKKRNKNKFKQASITKTTNFEFILLFALVVGLSLFQISISDAENAYAERHIELEKVVDVNKETFQNYITDLKNLPKIFPSYVKSVETISSNENKNLTKMVFGLNGITVPSEIEHKSSTNGDHVLEIITGDLKGTKLRTTLQPTWGFDGSLNEGTHVKLDLDLQFSGFLFFIGWVPDESIFYSLDYSLNKIVMFIKSDQVNEENLEDNNDSETKPKPKVYNKAYRKR